MQLGGPNQGPRMDRPLWEHEDLEILMELTMKLGYKDREQIRIEIKVPEQRNEFGWYGGMAGKAV